MSDSSMEKGPSQFIVHKSKTWKFLQQFCQINGFALCLANKGMPIYKAVLFCLSQYLIQNLEISTKLATIHWDMQQQKTHGTAVMSMFYICRTVNIMQNDGPFLPALSSNSHTMASEGSSLALSIRMENKSVVVSNLYAIYISKFPFL